MRAVGCSIGRWCVATGGKICSCTCSNNVHVRRVKVGEPNVQDAYHTPEREIVNPTGESTVLHIVY
jgi:hypothetical protein